MSGKAPGKQEDKGVAEKVKESVEGLKETVQDAAGGEQVGKVVQEKDNGSEKVVKEG